ncbi:MAG TPA: hypothetical protein VGW34_09005 [Allosphingosinicella sp.]|nr:hypothetical protein [Allosphingosinicella sp.]
MSAFAWPAAAVIIAGMIALAGLSAWRGWLALRREELAAGRGRADPSPGARIELADMKERLRKLEAIARGVDL